METPVVRSRGRPRKRRREDIDSDNNNNGNNNNTDKINKKVNALDVVNNVNNKEDVKVTGNVRKRGRPPKKRPVEIRGQVLVGRYVMKGFVGNEGFLGKIVSYESGLYRIVYDDGDFEDLDSDELREFVIEDEAERFVGDLLARKEKLDKLIAKRKDEELKIESGKEDGLKLANEVEMGHVEPMNKLDEWDARNSEVEIAKLSELSGVDVNGSEVDDDDDDSDGDDSCEYGQGWEARSEAEIPSILPPYLPPSSRNIAVPEEYVSHLFSVYGFLRSFSIGLFLSPFTLDDLVGCLNCTTSSTLLDSIHVALLRTLRRHLETLASDGSELASKCLRCIDWSLLDMLTWPVYLVHYLMVMGHLNGGEWKGFYCNVLKKDYCTLSVGIKLTVLQILCDDALDSLELRAEIDSREASEVGLDCDEITSLQSEPRKVFPRHCRSSIGMERQKENSLTVKDNGHNRDGVIVDDDDDGNGDECRICGMDGMLLCCDGCPSAYHSRCIGVNKLSIPEGEWFCPECTISRIGPQVAAGTALKGAEVFGVDSYAQLFLGTCDHLMVFKVSIRESHVVRYYNRDDIVKVITMLCSSPHHAVQYYGICQAILKYWGLPQTVIPPFPNSQTSMGLESKGEEVVLPTQAHPSDDKGSLEALYKVEFENYASSLGGIFADNVKPCLSDVSKVASGSSVHHNAYRPANTNLLIKGSIDSVSELTHRKWKGKCLYMGSHYKPYAYINHFVHGEYAASAAANFAVLSCDESQASGVRSSDLRKVMSANVSLQAKAFSSAATRFFWPNSEKKLIEIPRERCSWCLNCKAAVTSKKACLLNQAALNATRSAMKFISGYRLTKNVEGGLYSLATYTLYMEESLRGLIIGPFQSESYRQLWRKKVEQASTSSDMKSLLLKLEGNLCTIALSSEWNKLVDDWIDESSVSQGACPTGSTQKRGPGRRKKNLAVAEALSDNRREKLSDIRWWRGGKLAKLVFQRAMLPTSILRKAARQGGSKRIPGIYYADGSDVPKRSRQVIWRAAVAMARNVSQLALQVRYLDDHIKWSDLVRPEQPAQDGKGPESDASAFRNAFICDKKVVEGKIIYAVAFRQQKHLSSRLMKCIVEKEESKDGEDKYWFQETRVPLYLIKEYEENASKNLLPSFKEPPFLSKRQWKQMKASRKNILCYLVSKRDNVHTCLCASCNQDVMIRDAAKCNGCEGYCHKGCTMSSTVLREEDVEFTITCKQCSHSKVAQNNSAESPTSPLAMQGQEYHISSSVAGNSRCGLQYSNSATITKSRGPKNASQQLPTFSTPTTSSDKKPVSSDSKVKTKKRFCHWGLIWRKKNTDGDGSDFRRKNILFRGNLHDVNTLCPPQCYLCKKPYCPDLMYIFCQTCKKWYHADAVELNESNLSNLLGFKCCRCRRIKSPVCPYADTKADVKKLTIRGPKEEAVLATSASEAISEEEAESVPSTSISKMEDDTFFPVDDTHMLSVLEGEQVPEPKPKVDFDWNAPSVSGTQKLPVRRQVKNEKDDGFVDGGNPSLIQFPSVDGTVEDGSRFKLLNDENIDYEPQTYFSFKELLEGDDNNGFKAIPPDGGTWENLSCQNSQTGFTEQCHTGPSESTKPVTHVPCKFCSQSIPSPDLCCQNCRIQIHSHCSPWEGTSQGGNWSCGSCRAWC